jgi:hypothetical protein
MIIQVKKAVWTAVGAKKLVPFGMKDDRLDWSDTESAPIDLARLSVKELKALDALLGEHAAKDKGIPLLQRDIDKWLAAMTDAPNAKARTVEQFAGLLKNYLLRVPRHWVFQVDDEQAPDPIWLPYYVSVVTYHPPEKQRDDYRPAYVSMRMVYDRFGGTQDAVEHFRDEHIKGKTVKQALADQGYFANSPAMQDQHAAEVARFAAITKQVGTQFLASGFASDDPDGNREVKRDSWYYRQEHTLPMVRDGQKTRVVADVFFEERQRGDKDVKFDTEFWAKVAAGRSANTEDDDEDEDNEVPDLENGKLDTAQIPAHPWLVVFDLQKHLRLRLHVNQLDDYVYDPKMADKLVLSEDRKTLVKLLIESKDAGFTDIVQGKGGGAVVLLAGPPGTGKTLTAEVYAEAEGRALYSVQCSQLGTDPETLEEELLKVFARARRWNAVLLLDEADVYVHERGNDLQQNAIVGVFLRVLEYQGSVLFLTTNRPDDVDDAIASRCIAKLTYDMPTADQQKAIWRILAQTTGTKIQDDALDAIVDRNRDLSGRDIKNLLKLARVMSDDGVSPDAVEFVKQFKPTVTGGGPALPAGVIARCPKCGRVVGKGKHECRKN